MGLPTGWRESWLNQKLNGVSVMSTAGRLSILAMIRFVLRFT